MMDTLIGLTIFGIIFWAAFLVAPPFALTAIILVTSILLD